MHTAPLQGWQIMPCKVINMIFSATRRGENAAALSAVHGVMDCRKARPEKRALNWKHASSQVLMFLGEIWVLLILM
jgi:hypothetical protein